MRPIDLQRISQWMQKMLLMGALASVLAGCEQRQPVLSDEEVALMRAAYPGLKQACLIELKFGGYETFDNEDEKCFEYLPARRWTGFWDIGWEWSNFCPSPAQTCDWMKEPGVWMTFAPSAARFPDKSLDGTYRIDFIGRRTAVAGSFGHSNAYAHRMIVDRVLKVERIPGERYTPR